MAFSGEFGLLKCVVFAGISGVFTILAGVLWCLPGTKWSFRGMGNGF